MRDKNLAKYEISETRRDMHHHYRQWMEEQGYLKKNLDDACVKIAELTVENRELKQELAKLPIGRQAPLRNGI